MRISMNAPGISAMAGLASLVTLAALASPARAVVISVDLGSGPEMWDVSTTQVVAGTNPDTFIPTFITSQPWNGSDAIAVKFAVALGGKKGYPNNDNEIGPFFAYRALAEPRSSGTATYQAAGTFTDGVSYELFQLPSTDPLTPPPNNFYTYATATRVISDVPGPLPVLGGLAAFGWSRRLRRRVSLPTRP